MRPSGRKPIAQITDSAKREFVYARWGKGGSPRRWGLQLHCPLVALCDGPRKVGTLSRERGPVGSPDLSVFGERAIYVPIVPIVVPVPVPECPVPVPEVPVPVPDVPSCVPVPVSICSERATIARPAAVPKPARVCDGARWCPRWCQCQCQCPCPCPCPCQRWCQCQFQCQCQCQCARAIDSASASAKVVPIVCRKYYGREKTRSPILSTKLLACARAGCVAPSRKPGSGVSQNHPFRDTSESTTCSNAT